MGDTGRGWMARRGVPSTGPRPADNTPPFCFCGACRVWDPLPNGGQGLPMTGGGVITVLVEATRRGDMR